MHIGTVRPEEARVFDSMEGFHKFHAKETQEPYGSFEVFWIDPNDHDWRADPEYDEPVKAGWYWWSCFPRCLPDCEEPNGPFASSRQAHQDADEWSPDYDD